MDADTTTIEQDGGALAPVESEGGVAETRRVSEAMPAGVMPASTDVSPLVMLLASGQLQAESVEQALALQKQHDEYQAKRAWAAAFVEFKSLVGSASTSGNNTHLRTKYSTYDDVVAAVAGPLAAAGLSHRFETVQNGWDSVTVTCVLTHVDGHSERESRTYPVEEAKGITLTQRIGVSEGYGKRRTLLGITGIKSGEDAGDGAAKAAAPPIEMASAKDAGRILDLVTAIDELSKGFAGRWRESKADEYAAADNPLGLAVPAPAVERIIGGLTKRLETARGEQP